MMIQNLKNKGLSILIIIFIFSIVSCEQMIEIPPNPPDQIEEGMLFADSTDIMSAIAGIYSSFKVAGGGSNIFNGSLTQYMGFAADEMNYAYTSDFLTNTYLATSGQVSSFWRNSYEHLYRINACFEGVSTTEEAISSSLKESLLAELKVLRAYTYFYLVNLFDGVPLVTSTDYKANAVLPRSSVEEVYKFILQDLTAACEVLTPDYPSEGRARPNLYVAEALLARVYLYTGQYAEAEKMATEVINSGMYMTTSLDQVFLDGSTEAIWQLPSVGTSSQTYEGYFMLPYSSYSQPSYQVSSFLLESFEENDQRKENWVNSVTLSSTGITYYYPYKYKNRQYTDTPVEGYIFLRLAEQYLIRAEARAQQGTAEKLSLAAADVNEIRNRASLGDTEETTKEGLLNAIMQEKRHELFCEWGNRWFDLRRTGTIDEVLGAVKPGWQSYLATLPIPDTEIQNDPYLTQNTGY